LESFAFRVSYISVCAKSMAKLATTLSLAAGASLAAAKHHDSNGLGCIDGNGDAIDFWYSFKYPNGWDYAYMAKDVKLDKAKDTLDSDESALTRTLSQLYEKYESLSYAMWNDEDPSSKKDGHRAHAKGVVAFDGDSGFWITHSLPRFPAAASVGKPVYDGGSDRYGQSYQCITIDQDALSVLATAFDVDELAIYDSDDNANLGGDFKTWAISKKFSKTVKTKVTDITSAGGQKFTLFAKSKKWDDDLYDSLVAPHYKQALFTETWQNGVGKMHSDCTLDYKIQNVQTVDFPAKGDWKESQDHSKWVVSQNGAVFCVGDINRQTGQAKRGGGTTCITNKEIAKQMLDLVGDVEPCGNTIAANATVVMI